MVPKDIFIINFCMDRGFCIMKKSSLFGFTLIEIMVALAIVGVLAAVGTPLLFEQVERTRQKLDLVKLHYLRDALNKALVNSENALFDSDYVTSEDIKKKVTNALKSDKGLVLFVFAAQQGVVSGNVQGTGGNIEGDQTFCKLIGNSSGGVWIDALKEGGFEGVADIVAYRTHNMDKSYLKDSFKVGKFSSWATTYPNTPMFLSRALTQTTTPDKNGENYYGVSFQYTNKDPTSRSVEVYIIESGGNYKKSYRSSSGLCFSTYGDAGCK